jgi:hypothetical protein
MPLLSTIKSYKILTQKLYYVYTYFQNIPHFIYSASVATYRQFYNSVLNK